MHKCEQERQDLVKEDCHRNQNTMVDMTEPSDSLCGRQHHVGVVICAFRKVEKMLDAEGCRIWIHVEADRTWLTIRHEAEVGGGEEGVTTLKYQVEVSGQVMTSSLWQIMDAGLRKERLVGSEHEIAGSADGQSVTDITSQDIVDDFRATLEAYTTETTKS